MTFIGFNSCLALVLTLVALQTGKSARAAGFGNGLVSPQNFEVDASWPKPLPDAWLTGEISGTCMDAGDHVFIISRLNLTPDEQKIAKPAPPVIELDSEGKVVNSWGDLNVLAPSPHGCFVDHSGNIWIGGGGDGIVQKYSHEGSLLMQIGTRGRVDSTTGLADGKALNSSRTLLNGPSSIAVDPSTDDIYIADGYRNRRVVVFDHEGRFLRQWGSQATGAQQASGEGGVFVGVVHCVVLGNDGLVYVCDRQGDRIEVFDKIGTFKRNIEIQPGTGNRTGIGSAWSVAFSTDPEQTRMYVADGGNEKVWILNLADGRILSSFGRPGHQLGEFTFLHSISVDSKGNLYFGETVNGRRVQRFRPVNP